MATGERDARGRGAGAVPPGAGAAPRADSATAGDARAGDARAGDATGGDASGGAARAAVRARWLDRSALGVLLLQLALLVHGAWKVGPTYDEHFYAAAGYAYWRTGDFSLNREHPPLLKLLAGAPLAVLPDVAWSPRWRDEVAYPQTFFYQRNAEHLDRNLFLARLPLCALTGLLTVAAWRAARRRFGAGAGLACVLLLALNPNVLAHGRLAALDAGTAALLFVAAVAFVEALERPTARRQLAAAVLFGAANLAKFTSLLLGPLFVALAALQAWRERSGRPFLALARVFLGGLTVFAAGYLFEARSVNAALGVAPLVAELAPREVAPGELADAVRAELGERAAALEPQLAALARADRLEEAVWLWRRLLLRRDPPGTAEAAARAAPALAGAEGASRRVAFEGVLDAATRGADGAPTLAPELALPRLALLADRTLLADDGAPLPADERGLAAWSAWWAANRAADWDRGVFTQAPLAALTRGLLGDARPIPLLTALKGLDYQLEHGSEGHGTYFRGRTYLPGEDFADGNPEPEYYAVVMAVKNPLAFLLAAALGIALAFRFRPGWGPLELVAFVGFPALCFALFSTGNALMGVRYVLPVVPFLALLAARLEVLRPGLGIALGAVAALESLWIHPHQLMYYNAAAGGTDGGPAITVVGDDWGQDARALGRFAARHRVELAEAGGLHYGYYGAGDPAALGLGDARVLERRVAGIVAVHATPYYRERAKYRWLDDYEPFLKLGGSVWLYDTRGPAPGADPGWR